MPKSTIDTSCGRLWVEDLHSGELRVWWPPGAQVAEFAVEVLQGRARWHPQTRNWYVPGRYRDEVRQELEGL